MPWVFQRKLLQLVLGFRGSHEGHQAKVSLCTGIVSAAVTKLIPRQEEANSLKIGKLQAVEHEF